MTNGDAVRNMTDYELAHFMTAIAKLSAEKLCESIKAIKPSSRQRKKGAKNE